MAITLLTFEELEHVQKTQSVKQKQKSKPFLYHSAMVISDLFPPGPMLQGYRLHTTGLLSRRAPGSSLKTEHWPLFSDLRLNKGFPGGTSVKESETQLRFLGQEDPLEKGMATHSSILTWKIPHGQRSLAGYSPWGHNELEVIKHICTGSISFLTYFQR